MCRKKSVSQLSPKELLSSAKIEKGDDYQLSFFNFRPLKIL